MEEVCCYQFHSVEPVPAAEAVLTGFEFVASTSDTTPAALDVLAASALAADRDVQIVAFPAPDRGVEYALNT